MGRWSVAALCTIAIIAITGQGCAVPPVVVVSDFSDEPFAYLDAEQHPTGFEVDLLEQIADAAAFEIEWRKLEFDELLLTVESGEADVACASIGITPERAQRVSFSDPYYDTEIAVVVRSGVHEPQRLEDLVGRRVRAAQGTTSQRAMQLYLNEVIAIIEGRVAPGTPEREPVADRLLARRFDAAAMDGPEAVKIVVASNGQLRKLEEPLARERYAIVVRQSAPDLLRAINTALAEMERTGKLAALRAKHGL